MPFSFDNNRIHIGDGTGGNAGTTIGHNSSAQHSNSVALGSDSVATLPNEVSVGNSQIKRKITNVDKGIEPTDVVTVAQLQEAINSVKNNLTTIASQLYPIGAVYITVLAHNPADLFGGQWVKLPAGKMLINEGDGFNLNETGGEKEHMLTEAEMPAHAHVLDGKGRIQTNTVELKGNISYSQSGDNGGGLAKYKSSNGIVKVESYYGEQTRKGDSGDSAINLNIDASHFHTLDLSSLSMQRAGASVAHNNMPPYLVVNMWKRVG